MQTKTLSWLAAGGLILAVAAIHTLARRPGHVWGGDFAQYVHHAQNLVEGLPYAETGYLYDPEYPELGPRSYPPATAVLLAPVYWARGLDLEALKWAMLASLLLALVAVFLCFREELPWWATAALLVVFGLNRYVLEATNTIGSDLPFVALLYLGFWLLRCGEAAEPASPRRMKIYLAAAVVAYLAYATRSLGAVLIVAMVAADLVRNRRITRAVLLACAVFGGLAVAQSVLVHSDRSYLDQLGVTPAVVIANARGYGVRLAAFWHNGTNQPAAGALFAVVTLFALLGYVSTVRRRIGVCEVFLLLYLAVILLWPAYQGIRFLLPILPLYLVYALAGLNHPWLVRRRRWHTALVAALAVAVAVSYAAMAAKTDFGPLAEGVCRPESKALFEAVAQRTGPDDVVVFVKPRVMALFAGCQSSGYHQVVEDGDLWSYFEQIGAGWIVVVENAAAMEGFETPDRIHWFSRFARRNPTRLKFVWDNADFTLYQIRPPGSAGR